MKKVYVKYGGTIIQPNIHIIGIPEGKKEIVVEHTLNEITVEHFPGLERDMGRQDTEAQRTLSRFN